MKRLLILAMAVLLGAAGAGLVWAAAAPTGHQPVAARRTTLPIPPAPTMPAVITPGPSPVITPAPSPVITPATTPIATSADPATTAVTVEQAMQAVLPHAQVGFEVFDRQTDTVLTSQNSDQQVASMSVVKLLIALDVLARDNWATPDDATQQNLQRMLADSDDEIADQLWSAGGGPGIVTRMVGLLGLTGTRPPDDPGLWGDTLITPRDVVTVYRYITDQLPNPGRDLVLGALAGAPQSAADGFDQYFGIPDGMPNIAWAIKQGWGTSGAQAVMNSTGLVGTDLRYVVVLSASASADSYSTVPAVVTAGAGALAGLVGARVS